MNVREYLVSCGIELLTHCPDTGIDINRSSSFAGRKGEHLWWLYPCGGREDLSTRYGLRIDKQTIFTRGNLKTCIQRISALA
jgi:hypothetical protein